MMFKKDLLDLVVSGRKTQTRRLHRRVLKVGRIYSVKRNWFNCTGDYIRMVRVYRQELGDVSEEEAVKEGFIGLDEFRSAWIRINGSWDPGMEVVVYEFELVEPSSKRSRVT